jgi:flagellar hook-associated protein 3 FlgL
MAVSRITQNMLTQRSLGSLQESMTRMARLQEQVSTGRVINRPSDDPAGTTSAMRLRDSLAANTQYSRNADDGLAWLGTIDSRMKSITDQTRAARDLALQGANTAALGQAGRDSLAGSVDQLRAGLLSDANTTYLGRPVFGGITGGSVAYDTNGTFVGQAGDVTRTVAEGVKIKVNGDAAAVFGAPGSTVFDHLTALSTALRSGDAAGIRAGIDVLNTDLSRVITSYAEVGTRAARIEQASQSAADSDLSLKTSLSDVENVDLPSVVVNLKMQETAYQAALQATSRVMQPSLMDFLK